MATESDNVNSGALGTLLAVGTIATLGVALVVTALVRTEMSSEAEKKDVGADRPYRDLVAEQTATTSGVHPTAMTTPRSAYPPRPTSISAFIRSRGRRSGSENMQPTSTTWAIVMTCSARGTPWSVR